MRAARWSTLGVVVAACAAVLAVPLGVMAASNAANLRAATIMSAAVQPAAAYMSAETGAASATLTASMAGWDRGWVNQSVTLTATARGGAGTVVGVATWDAANEETPSAYATASADTTSFVVSREGTTGVVCAAITADTQSIAASATAIVRIDRTKPTLGFRVGAPLVSGWTSATVVPVTLVATETLSGLRSGIGYRVQCNGVTRPAETTEAGSAIMLLGEGRYAIEATATDLAGNASASTWTTMGVDASGPRTSWARRDYAGRARIELSPTDTLSGVAATFYRLDGEATQTGRSLLVTMPPEATQPVEHRLSFWSVDTAGNVETTSAASWDITFTITPDNTPPATRPSSGGMPFEAVSAWYPGRTTISLAATDAPGGSGVDSTYYRVNAGAVTTYTAPFVVSGEETTSVEYWSVDKNEVVETPKIALIRFDRTPPDSVPDVRSTYQPTALVLITGRDSRAGVATITAWVDSGTPNVIATGAPGDSDTLVGAATCSEAGTHTVSWVVRDFAGNAEETRTVTVHVKRVTKFVMSTKSATLGNTTLPATSSIKGRLMDGLLPVKGRRVYLQYSSSSSFKSYKSVYATTRSDGSFAFTAGLYSATYYRMRFGGDDSYFSATGPSIKLLPHAYVSTPKASSTTQRAYRSFTVSGVIKPAHGSSSSLLIKRYLMVGGKPVYKGYTRGSVTSKGTYSTYKAAVKLTRGTWRLTAYLAGDAGHAATTSGYPTIKVR